MRSLLKTLLLQFLFLFLYYTSFRMFFLLYNFSRFEHVHYKDILQAFALGFRFDIAAILMTSGIFLLIWFFGHKLFRNKYFDRAVGALFFVTHFFLIGLNIADVELVHFAGQRLTANYFAMSGDIESQAMQMIAYYWYVVTFFSIIFYIFVRYFPRNFTATAPFNKKSIHQLAVVSLILIALIVLGIRGGFQNKPLRVAHAYRFDKSIVGHLALNSTFTFIRSGKGHLQDPLSFMTDEKAVEILNRDRKRHFRNQWSRPQNVVVIIVESLATEYMGLPNGGDGYTPFLDSLAKKGLFIENFFANGRRSIEAIPSILASIPSLLPEAFLTSNYQGAKVTGLGEILMRHGYSTAFFHGAQNGTMFFDSFTSRAGFSNYYGLQEYPHSEKDYDGFWGIFDEPYLNYVGDNLLNFRQPFAAGVFTLSSHQPYTIPNKYKGKLKSGPLPIHETISYTDLALREFFEKVQYEEWFQNTLFIITGDHTSKSINPKYESDFAQYKVPLILFHPHIDWPKLPDHLNAQHADIMPTALDILDIDFKTETDGFQIGTSIFADVTDHFVVNRTPNGFWYKFRDQYIRTDEKAQLLNTSFGTDEQTEFHLNRLKAYLQYAINGLVKGRFFDPKMKSVKP